MQAIANRLWKFSRPHTIVGTSLSVLSLYWMAWLVGDRGWELRNGAQLLATWLACMAGNLYIVGLNQLEDVEIDRINKPHLPLAAGEFTLQQGQWIVAVAGIASLGLGAISGPWLLATVSVSLAIGTAYSLPPLRLKRFPLFAASCILTVRGLVVNLGLFLHFNQVLNHQSLIPPPLWLLTFFILFFTIAIAIFKDIPDSRGDRQYDILTFTLLLGREAIFHLSIAIVAGCYLAIILAATLLVSGVNPWTSTAVHLSLLGLLWWRQRSVDLGDETAIARFYQFIWRLFFLEYLLFPLTCLRV